MGTSYERRVTGGTRTGPDATTDVAARPGSGGLLALQGEIGNRAVCRLRGARAGGEPLPSPLRTRMERSFGVSLAPIRVHHDGLADDLGAEAVTHHHQIHLGRGQYRPHTADGQALLGHEVAHVMQQARGRVAVPLQARGWPTIRRDAALEREADAHGDLAARGERVPGDAPSSAAVQSLAGRSGGPLQCRIAATSFGELVEEQIQLQVAVKKDPERYARRYTTVGFEHEFGNMDTGPLRGRSHVEVAKTRSVKMPLTGIPYILETDAGNTLELVSPPLLIDTLDDKPIPLPSEIRKADKLIHDSLAAKTQARPTMEGLLGSFFQDDNLDFHLENVTLGWQNLSPNMASGVSRRTATLAQADLEAIQISPTTKGGGIGAQANFATDAKTFVALERAHRIGTSHTNDPFTKNMRAFGILERRIYDRLVESAADHLFQQDSVSAGLKDFLYVMARNLAGQLSIPSIQALQSVNQRAFRRGEVPDVSNDVLSKSSNVKDSGSTWIKDNLFNIGLGLLTADEWRTVKRICKDRTLRNTLTRWEILPSQFSDGSRDSQGENPYAGLIKGAMDTIRSKIKSNALQDVRTYRQGLHLGPRERVEFLGHKKDWISPRQDTHIESRKVQMPKIWRGKRLHVVETRRSLKDSLELLEGLDDRLAPRQRNDDEVRGLDDDD